MAKILKILVFSLVIMSGCKGDILMWHYKGDIFNNILPAVDGDMRVDPYENIYIFDPSADPMITFKPYTPPPLEELDNFKAEYSEPWMADTKEEMNRRIVRLFRSGVNSEYSLLFQEYGRNGYWWMSADNQTIYILVERFDYKKMNEPAHLTFWKSTNRGAEFTKMDWHNPWLGRGTAQGMYFDAAGVNGYIFIEPNVVWQTDDKGETWRKVYIPHTETPALPDKEISIDTATVDKEGNLLFSLFTDDMSHIYQILHDNRETNLSHMLPKYQVSNKRLLAMTAIPDSDGLYFFYIPCKEKDCTWYPHSDFYPTKENQPLGFSYFKNGSYLLDKTLGFFLPIKKVYANSQGKIAVTLEMPNTANYSLLLSSNYGEKWTLEDLKDYTTVSDYVDLTNDQYWQYRNFNRVFMAKDIFK